MLYKKIVLIIALLLPFHVVFGQSTTPTNPIKSLDYLVGGTWKGIKPIKIGGQEFTPVIEYRYKADKNMIYTISYKESSDGTREVNNEGFFIPIPEKEMVHYLVFPNGGIIEGDYRVGDSGIHESYFNYYPPGGGNKSKWRSTLKKISKDEVLEEAFIFVNNEWRLQTKIQFKRTIEGG